MSSVNSMPTNTSSVHSSPSNKGTASRNQSGNVQNLAPELREDLAHDVLKAKKADFDAILKFNLFLIMNSESEEKQNLNIIQKNIETLEREIDDAARTIRAQRNQRDVPKPQNQLGGSGPNPDQSDESPEMTQWKKDLDDLVNTRQEKLDRLLSECLDQVLPICNDVDLDLRHHLNEYSQANIESQMYAPFVRLCNCALDRLLSLSSKTFRSTDPLNCRLHVNDPKIIITSYKAQNSVHSKPDVVITSTVAATDAAHGASTNSPNPVFDKPPNESFKMRQVFGCGEFKLKKDNLNTSDYGKSKKGYSLTTVPTKYGKKRQSDCEWSDEDPSERNPVEVSNSIALVSGNEPDGSETGGRPAKRKKRDVSEPATASSSTTGQSSRGGSSSRAASSSRASSSRLNASSAKGSRGGKGPSNATTPAPIAESRKTIDARSQCAQYGMEMLSHALGVHRAIAFFIENCKIWVWYYDRQGIIQSSGIDFIQDLPRFLVLLFTFQRFNLTDWGIVPELNPGAILTHSNDPDRPSHSRSSRAKDDHRNARKKHLSTCLLKIADLDSDSRLLLDSTKPPPKEIEITFDDWFSHQTHQLAGRATAVLGCKDPGDETYGAMACKISFLEVARQNEGKTIERIRERIMSKEKSKSLLKHLPKVVTYGDMARYGTQRIRSMMGLDTNGCRTLRVLLSEKLLPLTTLIGADFVKAWLEAVKFHAYLWAIGWEHGDPSLWNVMYNDNLKCGVLSDYDLSICHHDPRVPGTERTGTIPFMAIELLTDEYWRGQVARLYRHELEAFIWILPFVFLGYQDQKFQHGTLVEKWMTSDYEDCRQKKNDFFSPPILFKMEERCQDDFNQHWPLSRGLLEWLADLEKAIFRPYPSVPGDFNSVKGLWPRFTRELEEIAARPSSKLIDYVPILISELDLHNTLNLV